MIADPVVVLAATQRGWAGKLRAHAADHGGVLIRATVLTPEDALAEASSVVLLDDITSFLTPTFVASLQQQGRAVVGLHDPDDLHGREVLVDAGVDALLDTAADPEELLGLIRRLAVRQPQDRPPTPVADRPRGRGRVIGVLGPPGGTGVTEVALELAAGLAAGDTATTLVDADELAPSLAQRLGLAVHPNLHTAVHAVDRAESVTGCRQALTTRRPLSVLVGMAVEEDWHTVRPGAVDDVIADLVAGGDTVVVDLGHALAPVEGPTGLRFGHAATTAAGCDELVVVTTPTPIAVSRAISLVARLQPARARLRVVLNQMGRDRFVRDEAVAELRRATGIDAVGVIHHDHDVVAAGWQGRRAGRGRFRRDVAQLVDRLTVVPGAGAPVDVVA